MQRAQSACRAARDAPMRACAPRHGTRG
jgi:hypothetical protein